MFSIEHSKLAALFTSVAIRITFTKTSIPITNCGPKVRGVMSAEAGPPAYVKHRRSTRLYIRLALIVCGDAGGFQEQTCTCSLNAHGVLVVLAAKVKIGQMLIIHNPENWAERRGRVTNLGRCYAGRTEVGIEFLQPAPDFWLTPAKHVHVD